MNLRLFKDVASHLLWKLYEYAMIPILDTCKRLKCMELHTMKLENGLYENICIHKIGIIHIE